MTDGAASPRDLAKLYDRLARYQALRRRLSGAAAGEGWEMHKRLRPPGNGPGPEGGGAGLHHWLLDRVELPPRPRVLDIGSGFGATLFAWAEAIEGGEFHGLGLSPFAARCAQREAKRRGLGARCRFTVRSYDEPLEDRYDAIVSVESLFHAPDLAATLRGLAAGLAPGGTLLLVEDMAAATEVEQDATTVSLLEHWATRRLATVADYARGLTEAGLAVGDEFDLTAQVVHRDMAELDRRRARLARWRRLLSVTGRQRVLEAFLGGLDLEELYERGLLRYRAIVAHREGAA